MSEDVQAPVTDTPAQDPTIASGGTGPEIQAPQNWPDNWRNLLAGEDDKSLKQLERYQSPEDIWKKTRNLEIEFSKRQPTIEYSPDMPPEKLAEYRKQQGIPESPDKYNLDFDDGLVIGENDKPFIDEYLKHAHASNIPESSVKESVKWFLESQSQQQEQLLQRNTEVKHETLAKLKAELGGEFQGSVNAIKELFTEHPEVEEALMGAMDEQGLQIGNKEQIVRWAMDIAKKLNPAATITLPGGESGLKAGQSRLAELKHIMFNEYERWHKSPDLQKEYDDLITRLPQ